MAKLIVSLEGVVIKEVQIVKDKTTLGRRPYNDVVIDNLAVSGEHAMVQIVGSDFFIEDCNSTNGTLLNGKPVRRQQLHHQDTIDVGKYRITCLFEEPGEARADAPRPPPPPSSVSPLLSRSGGVDSPGGSSLSGLSGFGALPPLSTASVTVLNGPAIGRQVPLTKVVTTVGKPGVQVASITKRPGGYVFAHVEGAARPVVNGQAVAGEPVALKSGDIIELAGTQMQFLQA